MLPEDGQSDLLLLGTLLLAMTEDPAEDPERAMVGLLDELEFTAGDRDRAVRTALAAPALVERLESVQTPSELGEAVHRAPVEALALASSLAEEKRGSRAAAAIRRWLSELRHVRLQITGDDLLAGGNTRRTGDRSTTRPRAAPQARRRAGRRSRGRADCRDGGAVRMRTDRDITEIDGGFSCDLPGGNHALFTTRAHGNLSIARGATVTRTAVRPATGSARTLGLQWLCAAVRFTGRTVQRV